ncbi:MAG: thioesterase family protein [Candidatus Omnitrophota bacterium]
MKVKIYYHHTDCGGPVYYARYLDFLEEARTELLGQKGVSVKELAGEGVLFVVARQEIDYKFPAYLGDELNIATRIANVSGVRIEFEYEIKNQDDKTCALAKTTLVCVNSGLKPKAIPEEIREKITQD